VTVVMQMDAATVLQDQHIKLGCNTLQ